MTSSTSELNEIESDDESVDELYAHMFKRLKKNLPPSNKKLKPFRLNRKNFRP